LTFTFYFEVIFFMNKTLVIVISCLAFIILCFFGGYFFLENEIKKPFKAEGDFRVFHIQENTQLRDIADSLKNAGLIRSDTPFIYYILKNDKDHLKDGYYCLSPAMNIPQIVAAIEKGGARKEVKITFPEGFRLTQIEDKLESNFNQKFDLTNLRIKDFKNEYSFLNDAPDDFSLEGYFFPDTYFFSCLEPEVKCLNGEPMLAKCNKGDREEIIQKFLSNFDKKLTSDLKEEIQKQNKTIFQIVTMASILEKEVQSFEDKQIVSGIFWKRIQNRQPLQSCSTVAYILNQNGWTFAQMQQEIAENKNIDSPYNTYRYSGLPAGPISNPGLDSIKAAIYPIETNYNYFLTDPSTGKTIFSKTLEEHNQNIAKYF